MIYEKYVGKEYKHNGRDDQLDCLGLTLSVLKDNGIEVPQIKNLKSDWYKKEPNKIVKTIKNYCDQIDVNELQQLDIVVFEFKGAVRHLGVMISEDKFIHARKNRKVSVVRLKHYKRFLHSCWRAR